MQTDDLDQRVRETVALALKVELPLTGDFARSDEPKWDSLKHVEMIFMLEDEFNVQFAEDDFAQLSSIFEIVGMVKARLEA